MELSEIKKKIVPNFVVLLYIIITLSRDGGKKKTHNNLS